jgi:hypothetical protein
VDDSSHPAIAGDLHAWAAGDLPGRVGLDLLARKAQGKAPCWRSFAVASHCNYAKPEGFDDPASRSREVRRTAVNRILYADLETSFADDVSLSSSFATERLSLRMTFPASPIVGGIYQIASVVFQGVLDLRFYDWDLGLQMPNEDDYEFSLIEIMDFEIVDEFAESNVLSRSPNPVVQLSDLRHFRIGFDDFGTFDVICTDVSLAFEKSDALPGSVAPGRSV